ncbi:MAG: biotin/lipoyl-containing protein, partial [Flavobacteriales bacterium]
MAEIIYMPKLSDTMTEGVVAEWTKKVGDKVASGEVLAEIETDKATMEFESFYDGVLLHIGVEKGQTAPVNSVLAVIGQAGEDISTLLAGASAPAAAPVKEEPKPAATAPTPVPVAAPVAPAAVTPAPAPVASSNGNGRVIASPLAKKIAEEKGIDIAAVAGTGEAGRIVKRDVDHYVPYTPAQRSFTAAPAGQSYQWVDCATSSAIPGATSANYTGENGLYAVQVTSANACTEESECLELVGISELNASSIRIYPVPATQTVTALWRGDKADYTITSPDGRVIANGSFNSGANVIDISALAAG